jgi:hypothetical protein
MLRRFIEADESGELMANTPQDVAVVRRLRGFRRPSKLSPVARAGVSTGQIGRLPLVVFGNRPAVRGGRSVVVKGIGTDITDVRDARSMRIV